MPKVNFVEVSQVESSYVVVFSCIAGALLLVSILSSLVLWARVSAVEDRQAEFLVTMLEKAPPKQLESAVAGAANAQSMVQTALLELGKYKEQIHGEMQRFYAIMRKKNKDESSFVKDPTTTTAETPETISAASLGPQEDEDTPVSKAELRKQARAAGL